MASSSTSFLINGIGAMGRGLAHQIMATPNATLAGLSDIDVNHAITCCQWLGLDHQLVSNPSEAEAASASGRVAVADDGMVLANSGLGEIYFEASSAMVISLDRCCGRLREANTR